MYKGSFITLFKPDLLKACHSFNSLTSLRFCYFSHNFLKVYYGSDVEGKPDLIEGDIGLKMFSAGYYQANGLEVSRSDFTSRDMTVRPKKPFSVSTKSWSKLIKLY